ncbi:hypothetical protein HMPREF0663_10416 [Hoylesella oralis ATCC 33269]|uniref:Uncharacterized protein n=1 Tax=Hoylesella oralis ATCC 33269 TaxID=873533 RepID=E7RMR6_9BACT|nr:hypothetical protein HMPREF0663_10416 [Hoylesella oralis ATCC 33269]
MTITVSSVYNVHTKIRNYLQEPYMFLSKSGKKSGSNLLKDCSL